MLEKLNKIYEQIISEAKAAKVPRRKRVRIKNIPTTINMDQYCHGATRPMRTPLTQKRNTVK